MDKKKCIWCKQEFPPEEVSNRGFCYDCAFERVRRWNELMREAHKQFIQEEIDKLYNPQDTTDIEKLWGDDKKD